MRDLREKAKNLRNLAKDQKGTPEGDLAAEILKRLKEKYPDLQVEEVTIQWSNKFKDDYELQLWYLATKAHEIKILQYNVDNRLELLSEGDEVEMIMAKTEWEFASKQFFEMATQVLRGIVNKMWPTICKGKKDLPPDYMESQFSDFAHKAMERTITPRKAIKEGKPKTK